MKDKIGVKFTYYRMGITISRMTGLEDIEEVMNQGLEIVAMDCIKELGNATGMDFNKLSHPYSATRFCFFSELSFDTNEETLIEGKQIKVLNCLENAVS
jgi:putative N-acetylmannosamine-6-phosphate epimerase